MGSSSTSHGRSQKVQPTQLHQRSAARRTRTSRTRTGLSAKGKATIEIQFLLAVHQLVYDLLQIHRRSRSF
jgi:hypothetical protein